MAVPTSDNVAHACTFCGGGPTGGFMRRTGADGHAEWCIVINPAVAAAMAGRPLPSQHANQLRHAQHMVRARRYLALSEMGHNVKSIAAWAGVHEDTVRAGLRDARAEKGVA
jgi:hypothetical protein